MLLLLLGVDTLLSDLSHQSDNKEDVIVVEKSFPKEFDKFGILTGLCCCWSYLAWCNSNNNNNNNK